MDIRGGLLIMMFVVVLSSFALGDEYVSGELIVKYKDTPSVRAFSTTSSAGASSSPEVLKVDKNADIEELAKAYSQMLNVEYAEPNYIYHTFEVPNDPSYSSQWHLPKIEGEEAWNLTFGNETIVIAIIDTGVEWSHSDLAENIWNNTDEDCDNSTDLDGNNYFGDCRGYDFVNIQNEAECSSLVEDCNNIDNNPQDAHGHGTHVAGISAAVTNNSNQVSGICSNCKIMPLRAGYSDTSGNGSLTSVAINNSIRYATDNNATIISMSFGGPNNNQIIEQAITYAQTKGVIMVAASGNDDSSIVSYPAAYSGVISVGSTDSNDQKSSFSNYGSWVDITAPGHDIFSTYLNNGLAYLSGTSMSTPLVAGAIGLIKSVFPDENQTTILDALNTTGTIIDFGGQDKSRINVYSALLSLDESAPNITLTSPENETQSTNVNQTFVCNFTDWQLKNSTFYLYNSTDLINQTEFNITGTDNSTSLQINNLSEGDYSWTCSGSDNKSNYVMSDNNTLSIAEVFVTQESPSNETYTIQNDTDFNCSAEASSGLFNITFYLYNSTNLINQTIINITGTQNSSLFNYVLPSEDVYLWNCEASNAYSVQSSNYTIIYDITSPLIENLSESPSYSSATITFDAGEFVNYSLNYSSGNINSSEYLSSPSILLSGLKATTTYNYNLTVCDQAGNCNVTNSSFMTTSAPSSSGGGSRSPGGGGSPILGSVENPVEYDGVVDGGYSAVYFAGQSKYFKDGLNNTHNVTLDNVIQDIAVVTIRSDPVTVYLLSNQSYKLNLTSEEYYDMQIFVGGVFGLSANITIKAINESIPGPIKYYITEKSPEVVDGVKHNILLIISLAFIILLLSVALSKLLKRKKAVCKDGKR